MLIPNDSVWNTTCVLWEEKLLVVRAMEELPLANMSHLIVIVQQLKNISIVSGKKRGTRELIRLVNRWNINIFEKNCLRFLARETW